MIAIIDGGSTKADWILLDDDYQEFERTETPGFNPYLFPMEQLPGAIHSNPVLEPLRNQISRLFYYGSGCALPENEFAVHQGLKQVFPQADISVKEDMVGAAYAAYTGQPVMLCILGTGTNSCFFDGNTVRRDLPSFGFILGDEGSGSALGKTILKDFFMKQLPPDLSEAFQKEFPMPFDEVLQNIYKNARANAFLASFFPFVYQNRDHPYINKIIEDEFQRFFHYHVLPYPEAKLYEIHFIGSVAMLFHDSLIKVADKNQLRIGNFIAKPINNLVQYHISYILNQN